MESLGFELGLATTKPVSSTHNQFDEQEHFSKLSSVESFAESIISNNHQTDTAKFYKDRVKSFEIYDLQYSLFK